MEELRARLVELGGEYELKVEAIKTLLEKEAERLLETAQALVKGYPEYQVVRITTPPWEIGDSYKSSIYLVEFSEPLTQYSYTVYELKKIGVNMNNVVRVAHLEYIV